MLDYLARCRTSVVFFAHIPALDFLTAAKEIGGGVTGIQVSMHFFG